MQVYEELLGSGGKELYVPILHSKASLRDWDGLETQSVSCRVRVCFLCVGARRALGTQRERAKHANPACSGQPEGLQGESMFLACRCKESSEDLERKSCMCPSCILRPA